jgi:hypothetical protein
MLRDGFDQGAGVTDRCHDFVAGLDQQACDPRL